jgi:uncharacterized protein
VSAEAPRHEGFVPGRHPIDAYGAGGFRFAGMGHIGSILATPRGVASIAATSPRDISDAMLKPLFDEMAAARVYNVMLGENRRVAALLLAAP